MGLFKVKDQLINTHKILVFYYLFVLHWKMFNSVRFRGCAKKWSTAIRSEIKQVHCQNKMNDMTIILGTVLSIGSGCSVFFSNH